MGRRSRIWLGAAAVGAIVACGPSGATSISVDTASVDTASVDTAAVDTGPVESPAEPASTEIASKAPAASGPTSEPEPAGDPELTGTVSLSEVVSPGAALPQRPFDDVIAHSIRDNEEWWEEIYPDLYGANYVPVSGGFFPGYPGRRSPIPGCPGPEPMTMEEIESFLALYCQTGDFFAYDDGANGPLADLIDRHGNVVIAVILSHEWAHAIQTRAGIDLDEIPTILSEQQADCFAGAWSQHAMSGESAWIHLDDSDIDSIVSFYGDVADPADTDPQSAQAHGSYLDRLGAFGAGFDSGPRRCVDLIDEPLLLLGDMARTGSPSTDGSSTCADCEETIARYAAALNAYWGDTITVETTTAPTSSCSDEVELPGDVRACRSRRVVVLGRSWETATGDHHDFRTATLLANAWALINADPTDTQYSPSTQVRLWCEVGRWANSGNSGAADDVTGASAVDIDTGLRAIVDAPGDVPLLIAATAYRRGVLTGSC